MPAANPYILTVNGGSSSIKFAMYPAVEPLRRTLDGSVDRIGMSGTTLTLTEAATRRHDSRPLDTSDYRSAAAFLVDWLAEQNGFDTVRAVGHRVVYGMQHTEPELVTPELLEELHRISPYDPDHLPGEIELIEAFRRRHPKLPQVACFDTAFHLSLIHIYSGPEAVARTVGWGPPRIWSMTSAKSPTPASGNFGPRPAVPLSLIHISRIAR